MTLEHLSKNTCTIIIIQKLQTNTVRQSSIQELRKKKDHITKNDLLISLNIIFTYDYIYLNTSLRSTNFSYRLIQFIDKRFGIRQ